MYEVGRLDTICDTCGMWQGHETHFSAIQVPLWHPLQQLFWEKIMWHVYLLLTLGQASLFYPECKLCFSEVLLTPLLQLLSPTCPASWLCCSGSLTQTSFLSSLCFLLFGAWQTLCGRLRPTVRGLLHTVPSHKSFTCKSLKQLGSFVQTYPATTFITKELQILHVKSLELQVRTVSGYQHTMTVF